MRFATLPTLFDVLHQPLTRLLGRRLQVLELLDAPVREHDGHEDLVVVRGEVVDPGVGDDPRVRLEVFDAGAGHLEGAHLTLDRRHHARRVDLERRRHEVAVEEVVQVLVGGDAAHDRRALRVVEQLARVAVRDAGGELLQRDVDDAVGDAVGVRHEPHRHLTHPRALELAHVDRTGHREVVADHDRVATLLGRPPAVPLAPHVAVAELAADLAVVVREVVLGEDVEEERTARALAQLRRLRIPALAFGVVAAAAPRHELVREPLLGGTEMTLEQRDRRRFELGEQLRRRPRLEGSPPINR